MNQITFKRVVVALYLAYSIATDTIIWGGALYYFFFHQGFSYAEISHLSRNRAHCHADFNSRLADINTKRFVKAVFSCLNNHLAGPGRAEPVFVNENNALRATFKP